MKWKFLREHHRRLEKASNGSGVSAGSVDSGGVPRIRVEIDLENHQITRKWDEAFLKKEALHNFIRTFEIEVSSSVYRIREFKFNPRWDKKKFLKRNKIEGGISDSEFQEVVQEFSQRYQMAKNRIARAEISVKKQGTEIVEFLIFVDTNTVLPKFL